MLDVAECTHVGSGDDSSALHCQASCNENIDCNTFNFLTDQGCYLKKCGSCNPNFCELTTNAGAWNVYTKLPQAGVPLICHEANSHGCICIRLAMDNAIESIPVCAHDTCMCSQSLTGSLCIVCMIVHIAHAYVDMYVCM